MCWMVKSSFLKKLDFIPSPEEQKALREASEWIMTALKLAIARFDQKASAFVGGSYAKGTLIKSTLYDIDVLLRCDAHLLNDYGTFESLVYEVCESEGLKYERVHGSRDYFRIMYSENIVLELIPVLTIKKPQEAGNVTDLSYSHVAYVNKELRKKKNLGREIRIAKQFCKGQRVYGAESYIQGFSGYAVECLIIQYGSFAKMIKELTKAKEKIILDPGKQYKNKHEVMLGMNESKLQGPVVLVDPTFKERNVLAALSKETFVRFQEAGDDFLARPSLSFFEIVPISLPALEEQARKKGLELIHLQLKSEKQAGDIAGTKLRKFGDFLAQQMGKSFALQTYEFVYGGAQHADMYLIVRPLKKVMRKGPSVKMKEHAQRFKKEHKKVSVKKGRLYAELVPPTSGESWLQAFMKKNAEQVKGMDLCEVHVAGIVKGAKKTKKRK